MSNGTGLTWWGEGVSLPLVGNPSMPYGVDVLHGPASHPIFFPIGLVKTESTCQLVDTGIGVFWLHYTAW